MVGHVDIYKKINTTNNGKLLLFHFDSEERLAVNKMLKDGLLVKATFTQMWDSVRIPSHNSYGRMQR